MLFGLARFLAVADLEWCWRTDDGMCQSVIAHRLVTIHRVQARGVEACLKVLCFDWPIDLELDSRD